MNVDSSLHGLPDWHFPSPTSTPRSSAPEQAPFQTPKCPPSSHFLDAFYTPRITGHQTPAATPVTQNEIAARTPTSTVPSPLTPQDPQFHVNHYRGGHLPLPPVEASRRLSSTTDGAQTPANLVDTTPKIRPPSSMDNFNLQTPPPTRESSTRRQYVPGQQDVASTSGQTFPPGMMQTPIRHTPQNLHQNSQFQTPVQLTQLQFSPAMFQFPNAPASAPAMPNQRFSWDTQSPSFSFANDAMMSSQQDAFGLPNPISPGFAQWQTPNMSAPPPQQPFSTSFNNQGPAADFWTTPALSSQPTPGLNETSSFASTITTTGVDPSMIFSFTSPPREANTSPIRPHITPQKIDTALRQPYEHQMRESNREKELAKKARQSHSRSNTGSASISFGRPGLQRSNTDVGIRRPRLGLGENNRAAQIIEQVERRPSPLKRHSQLSLSAIPEAGRVRPKTRLVVGEDGRARTETIGDPDIQDIRQHGFDVWDDSSSDEDIMTNSQRNSLDPDALQRRSSKHGRTGSDLDRFDPNKRPVSSASISSLASRLETTPIGKRSSREINYRRFSSGSFSGSLSARHISPSKEDEVMEDGTDAQAALKKMMSSRSSRRDAQDPQAIVDAHNQRWSQASIDVAKFNTMHEQNAFDPFGPADGTSLSPTSGTDPDILTPSTEQSTRSNESTRCVCNMSDVPDQMMIQCESCKNWLHVKCVNLPVDRISPNFVYLCVFCTGTTPLARGARIREPTRRAGMPPHASPLGYKSGNYIRR